ncbi:hypothetical protein [Streptomyces sp. NPDC051218]|uniref:hypothetical protein n=1 Tax=Streptomyces sp. NPDC051218 TaxID=3365645 RepID=UPI003787DA70
MSDLYELQLALNLPDSVSDPDIALLRWHLDGSQEASQAENFQEVEEYPLLSSTGSASRIGGALVGELQRGPCGWALAVRQEIHPDQFGELHSLLMWLAARTTTIGTIGYLRFLEADIPDVLIADSGTVRRLTSPPVGSRQSELLPGGWC